MDPKTEKYRALTDEIELNVHPSMLMLSRPKICIYTQAIFTNKVWVKNLISVPKELMKETITEYLNDAEVDINSLPD